MGGSIVIPKIMSEEEIYSRVIFNFRIQSAAEIKPGSVALVRGYICTTSQECVPSAITGTPCALYSATIKNKENPYATWHQVCQENKSIDYFLVDPDAPNYPIFIQRHKPFVLLGGRQTRKEYKNSSPNSYLTFTLPMQSFCNRNLVRPTHLLMEERFVLPAQPVTILGHVEDVVRIDGTSVRILNPLTEELLNSFYFEKHEWDLNDRWAWKRCTSESAIIVHSYDELSLPAVQSIACAQTTAAYATARSADADVVSAQGFYVEQA